MRTTTTALSKATCQFTKRISSTIYEVNIDFNQDAKETMDEIILRLIKNEAESGRFVG